jgi:hypothetical protein
MARDVHFADSFRSSCGVSRLFSEGSGSSLGRVITILKFFVAFHSSFRRMTRQDLTVRLLFRYTIPSQLLQFCLINWKKVIIIYFKVLFQHLC